MEMFLLKREVEEEAYKSFSLREPLVVLCFLEGNCTVMLVNAKLRIGTKNTFLRFKNVSLTCLILNFI